MEKESHQNVKEKLGADKRKMWKIDKQMLPYKIHYFFYIGAVGAIQPYHPTIGITRLGLGAGNLAVVFAVQQFIFIVFKPIIGYITDYFNSLKGMIVTLTVINGVLSYLLLAIPKIDDRNLIGIHSDSPLTVLSPHNAFCKLCPISSDFKKMAEHLPTVNFQDETFCTQEYIVSDSFAGYCSKSSNSSDSSNTKLEIEIRECYATSNISKNIDVNRSNKKTSIIFIKMYHNWISSEFSIVCPNIENSFGLQILNLTVNNMEKFCFKYQQDDISTNNATLELYPRLSRDIACNNSEVSEADEKLIKSHSFKTYQFWLYTLLIVIASTCTSSIFMLSDTACYESVQKTGADYGKQRAWGAIGWGLFAPFSGFLNDYTDDYWASMILMTLLSLLQLWNLSKIDLVKPQRSQSILNDVRTILRSYEFIAFEVGVFLNGMGIGIVLYFLSWFITDIGGSRLLIGLSNTVQCFLGELPCMIFSGCLIRKMGHFNVVSMALIAHSIRFLAYSSLKDPWWILPIECLDGITFGAFYSAMTSFGKMNAKSGTEATAQSLLCAALSLGAGLGCFIGGAFFDYYGGYTTFFYAGLCFAVAAAGNTISTILLQCKKRSAEITNKASSENVRY